MNNKLQWSLRKVADFLNWKKGPDMDATIGEAAAANAQSMVEAKPDWVRRQIDTAELSILAYWIEKTGAKRVGELGVASGFSAAAMYEAMKVNTKSPEVYSFDLARECYYDRARMTGQAFAEIHGSDKGFNLTLGVTSSAVENLPELDFLLIDANHGSPWPALDVLSLGRFLRPGGWIALDDVDMALRRKWHWVGKYGALDLYRSWIGEKLQYQKAMSFAILHDVTPTIIAQSVYQSLLIDWDEVVPEEDLKRYCEIAEFYPEPWGEKLKDVLMSTHRQAAKGQAFEGVWI